MADATRPYSKVAAKPVSQPLRPRRPIPLARIASYTILGVGTFITLVPFMWMISWSLMTNVEVTVGRTLPRELMFENYAVVWTQGNFGRFIWNSVRITGITITGLLAFSIPAAYAFARVRFRGRNVLFAILLSTLMIPEIVTLIPNFLTVIWLSRLSESLLGPAGAWINNWPSLTVPFMANAFTIFLLRQFFAQIPTDLWDAARIDGAGHILFMLRVVVPLSKAPIMTVLTFAFIASWNALLWPLLVVTSDTWRPVAFGLAQFVQADAGDEFHLQMAGSVIMIVPILIVYFFTQKQFTEGIASSGLKG